jgi:hypothetical protein
MILRLLTLSSALKTFGFAIFVIFTSTAESQIIITSNVDQVVSIHLGFDT